MYFYMHAWQYIILTLYVEFYYKYALIKLV